MGWSGSLTANSAAGSSITFTPNSSNDLWNYTLTSFTAPKAGVYRFILNGSGGPPWAAPDGGSSKTIRASGGKGGSTTYYRFLNDGDSLYAGCGCRCSCAYLASANATKTSHALSSIAQQNVYAVAGGGGEGGLVTDENNETQYNCVQGSGGSGGGSSGAAGSNARDIKGGGGGTQTGVASVGRAGAYGSGGVRESGGASGYYVESGNGGDGWYGGNAGYAAGYKWVGADAAGGGGGSSYCNNGLNGTITYAGTTYTNSTTTGGGANVGGYGSIVITYVQEANGLPTAPTSVWVNKSTADSLGEKCYLSWSGATAGFMNKITAYNIYRNGTLLASIAVDGATSYSNYAITAPTSPSTTYTYTITTTATFTQDSSSKRTSAASNGATLKTIARTAPSAPTNVAINNATTCYIGASGLTSLNISWTTSSAGVYNSVSKYKIYKDGASIGETTSTSYSLLSLSSYTGSYTVYAVGSAEGQSSASSAAKVVQIAAPSALTITSTTSNATSTDVPLSWNSVSAPTGSSITYFLQYKQSDKAVTNEKELTATQYTFSIDKIEKGKTFDLYLYAKANASGGSYTLSKVSTVTTMRVGVFDLPATADTFWKGVYDPESLLSGRQGHAYGSIALYWAPATPTEASGTIYTYTLKCKVGSSAWNDIYTITKTPTDSDYGQNLYYNYSLANINSNTAVSFYVLVTDNYNIQVSSAETQVIKLAVPSVSNFTTNISYKKAGASFTAKWTTNGLNDNLAYALYFSYDDKEKLYAEEDITVGGTGIVPLQTYEIKVEDGKNANTNTFLGAIYDTVITQKLPYPEGNIRVKVYYKSYPKCYINISDNVTYNFLNEITSAPKITYNLPSAHSTYCNPSDIVTYSFTPIGWADAAGETNGATVTYDMKSNYQINFSSSQLPNTNYTTVMPEFQVDDVIIYTLTTKITYADGNSRTNTTSISFNAARWYNGDSLLVTALKQNGGTVTGNYSLPSTLWSSSKYNNLVKVVLTIYNEDKTKTYAASQKTITDFNNLTLLVPFTFSGVNESIDLIVCAQAMCTNTSGQTFTIYSSYYIARSAAVTMALRKGSLGLNVGGDFAPTEEESTLYINAKPKGAAPTIVISEDAEQPNDGRVIQLKKGLIDYGGLDIKNDSLVGRGMAKSFPGQLLLGTDLSTNTITVQAGDGHFKNNCPIVLDLDYASMTDAQKRASKHLRILSVTHNTAANSVTITYRSNKILQTNSYIPFMLQVIGVTE